MSSDQKLPESESSGEGHKLPLRTPRTRVRKKSLVWHISRATAWVIAGVLMLLLIAIGGGWWYTTTPSFQRRVAKEIVSVLENATGGRVEVGSVKFSLLHLAIDVNGLVIHGLEGPDQEPYLAADAVQVRVKIINFFSRSMGHGLASHIGLNLLRVVHPRFHLIIYKDGRTNQPVPNHPSTSKEPLQDTLLDLKATEAELVNGVALINDRAIPFNLAARDLSTEVHYIHASDRYGFTVDLDDLRTKMKQEPEAQSRLHLEGELGRDMAHLTRLEFDSGVASKLQLTASLHHFAHPEWSAAVHGTLALKQISVLTAVEGLTSGSVDLNLKGHSCAVSPSVAQKAPHFWQRRLAKPAKPGVIPLPPDPECKAGYLVVGSAKIHKAGYEAQYLRLHDVDGGAQLHITPQQLLLTALSGYLPGGGSAAGELRIEDWLGEVPTSTQAGSSTGAGSGGTATKTAPAPSTPNTHTPSAPIAAHAYLVATVNSIPLRTIMEVTETKGYGDLGFDTAVSGPVKVEWGGAAKDIADTVTVDGNIKFRPTGVPRRGALENIPVTGEAVARYDGSKEVVNIQHVVLLTPQSSMEASGVLGVNEGDPLTNLRVNMTVHHLGEFDQLLQTLGFTANGKKGAAAVPVVLHGAVAFQGTASGRAANLDVKGHVQGQNIEVNLGPQLDTQVDSVIADAEYSFESGLAIASSTIKRGNAVLNVEGTIRPHKLPSHHGISEYAWNDESDVNATIQLANADVQDLLQIAGQQQKYPISGTIAVNGEVHGPVRKLNGKGRISLLKGVAYGEPYDSALVNLAVQGDDIEATNVALVLHGIHITGSGGYDLGDKHLHGHIQGKNLVLSKFVTVKKARPNADGTLTFIADASGTLEQPGLKASLSLAHVVADGKSLGDIAADVHSDGSLLHYSAKSTLIGTKFEALGETQLTGNYQTQAKLNFSGFDLGAAVTLFSPGSIQAQSSIGGQIAVDGPLKTPKSLNGLAQFNDVDVKLEGIQLKSAGPIRISLRNGIATLDQVHITGEDTDLQASGTVQAFGATDPRGGRLNVKANGSVSVALLHTFDPDILSSGKIEFAVAAGGQVKKPALTGKMQFVNVNAAMDGIPNGLSAMNGTLVFNQDRLQVQNLTATTGGGTVKLGGFLTYKNGIYADLTATGDVVRVRLYGLSTTANTNLRLQGGAQSLLLSGTVLITRFGVGPDVDFAAFSSAGGVSAPPDPNSASSKVRLDVRVTSSPQLDFQNSYAKLAGTVDLTLRGTVASPSILGRIQITYGSATFAGTKYELQRGDIYFNNPVRIDPTIDIDATARVETYDITVGLQGTMSNLKPTYRSEPPLSEADIFALLALGRTQEEAQLYQEQEVQEGADPTTSALLGGALNATVSNRIGKLFGGGTVKIDPAFVGTLGNSTARITVQKQITRQLGVTYATNVNSTAEPLLQGEYDLTPNVSLVVARDETGVFSVVYKIRRRYR